MVCANLSITDSIISSHFILYSKHGKINEIVNKKHSITAETAPALAGVLKTSPEFWLNLQSNYELWQAKAIN